MRTSLSFSRVKSWRYYPSLRRSLFIPFVLFLPILTFLHNRRLEPHLDKFQYLLIHDALGHQLHQSVMGKINIIKKQIERISEGLLLEEEK